MTSEEKKDKIFRDQRGGGTTPDATKHEGVTGTSSEVSSGEEYSSSQES